MDDSYGDAVSKYNPTPGTGKTGYVSVPPNPFPFYAEVERYVPVIQSDGGQLSGVYERHANNVATHAQSGSLHTARRRSKRQLIAARPTNPKPPTATSPLATSMQTAQPSACG